VFRVVDTGTGFSADQLAKFNEPLTGAMKESMGLGLMMVKRLMAGAYCVTWGVGGRQHGCAVQLGRAWAWGSSWSSTSWRVRGTDSGLGPGHRQ
jgi:hypothetical protein